MLLLRRWPAHEEQCSASCPKEEKDSNCLNSQTTFVAARGQCNKLLKHMMSFSLFMKVIWWMFLANCCQLRSPAAAHLEQTTRWIKAHFLFHLKLCFCLYQLLRTRAIEVRSWKIKVISSKVLKCLELRGTADNLFIFFLSTIDMDADMDSVFISSVFLHIFWKLSDRDQRSSISSSQGGSVEKHTQ